MEINIVRCIFIFNAVFVGIIGISINYMELYLPQWLTRFYLYGKFGSKIHHVSMMKCEVPKKWFQHFYIFSTLISTVTLCILFNIYFCNGKVPEIVLTLLDTFLGASRKPLISTENTIVAVILIHIQCCKRLYETTYVSVFSDQKMNITQYVVGYVHYLGVNFCLLGESNLFFGDAHRSWNQLTITTLVCIFIFLWSSYMQLHTNFILANIRKNKDSVVVSYNYNIPFHGLFEYISGSLQFTEILMYLMLSLIIWQASTFHYITVWVLINQTETAYLTHQWYHKTFKNYPKNRKILIPYIW